MNIDIVYKAVLEANLLYEVLLTANLSTENLKNFRLDSLTNREKERFILSALDWDVI